jgi:hypothetical protein
MRQETMRTSLETAISSVLETMFFQSVQVNDSDCGPQDWLRKDRPILASTLDFDGPIAGRCYLLLPVAVIREMTANFLGIEKEDVRNDQGRDTLKEALNMIGGHMLSLADEEGICRLGIPDLVDEHNAFYDRLDDLEGDMLLLETDACRLAAGICLD